MQNNLDHLISQQDTGLHETCLAAIAAGHLTTVRSVARRVVRAVVAEVAQLPGGADRWQLAAALARAGGRLLRPGAITDGPPTPEELAAWSATARFLGAHAQAKDNRWPAGVPPATATNNSRPPLHGAGQPGPWSFSRRTSPQEDRPLPEPMDSAPDPVPHSADLGPDQPGPEEPPPPYERQPGEGQAAWAAFCCYRDLGPRRSLDEVGRWLYPRPAPDQHQTSASAEGSRRRRRCQVGQWSRQHNWVARAAAWDAELDRQNREAQVHAVREMNARHARQGRALQAKAMRALRALAAQGLGATTSCAFWEKAANWNGWPEGK